MSLTKKQQTFIKDNLTDKILNACSDSKDNIHKFTVISNENYEKPEIKDLMEQREILLKRQSLWEIVIKCTALITTDSGQEVMVDAMAAIEAIAELNKLDGHYAPQQFEYTVKFVDGGSPA